MHLTAPQVPYEDAIALVIEAFLGQRRRGPRKIPTSTHSISVMMILLKAGFEQDVVIAGACHDLLEDTKVSYHGLFSRYGEHIAKLVRLCTIDTELEKTDDERAEQLLFEKVADAARAGETGALAIKAADSMDNLMTLADLSPDCQRASFKRAMGWYAEAMMYFKDSILMKQFNLVLEREANRLQATV